MGKKLQLLLLLCAAIVAEAKGPWHSEFTPAHTYYIGPNAAAGAGDGSEANPFNIHTAMNRGFGDPGDLYVLLDGEYLPRTDGSFLMKCDGSSDASPCVLKCPSGKCRLRGLVEIYAQYFWLWGVEVADPGLAYSDVDGGCPIGIWRSTDYYHGVRLINNYVHDMSSATRFRNGICAYDELDTVVYGNVLVGNGHNLYTSNDYSKGDLKYIVNNMMLDVRGNSAAVPTPGGGTHKYFNIHAYVEGASHGMGSLTGMYVAYNIVKDGRTLVGSAYEPDWGNQVRSNVLMGSRLQVGYSRTAQAVVSDNLLAFSMLQMEYMWGAGETEYSYPSGQTTVSGNMILFPQDAELGSTHVRLGVRCNTAEGRVYTTVRPGDSFNGNSYTSTFSATATTSEGSINGGDANAWQSLTGFDSSSNFGYTPGNVVVRFHENDYDEKRVHIALINTAGASSVVLDMCSFANVVPWQSWALYNASFNILANPLAHGARAHCTLSISFASGERYAALLLVRSTEEDPNDPITSSMSGPLPDEKSSFANGGDGGDDTSSSDRASSVVATMAILTVVAAIKA